MTRGVLVHGVLLIVALTLGYRTLHDDDGPGEALGDVEVWSLPADSIRALTYVDGETEIRIERREEGGDRYLWGIQRGEDRQDHGHDHDHDHHDHGHGHDHDHGHGHDEGHVHDYEGDYEDGAESGAESPAAPAGEGDPEAAGDAEDEDGDGAEPDDALMSIPETDDDGAVSEIVTVEFPVGGEGEELFELYADLTAVRDLGIADDEQRESFELDDPDAEITVELHDGSRRLLTIGERVFGGADRYVLDGDTGRAYVMHSRVIRTLGGGQSTLRLRELHDFEPDEVASVIVETGTSSRELVRTGRNERPDDHPGFEPGLGDVRWAYAEAPGEPSQTLANFLGRVDDLRPRSYAPKVSKTDLELLLALTYRDEGEGALGALELYRSDAAGDDGAHAYYVFTEQTRVLGEVSPLAAERVDTDISQIFSADPDGAPAAGPGAGEPADSPPMTE